MKPIDFKGSNAVYAKDQPEYQALPVYRGEDGLVASCWKLSLFDKIKLLFTGRVWILQHTFNQPLQPLSPLVTCPLEYSNEQANRRSTVS